MELLDGCVDSLRTHWVWHLWIFLSFFFKNLFLFFQAPTKGGKSRGETKLTTRLPVPFQDVHQQNALTAERVESRDSKRSVFNDDIDTAVFMIFDVGDGSSPGRHREASQVRHCHRREQFVADLPSRESSCFQRGSIYGTLKRGSMETCVDAGDALYGDTLVRDEHGRAEGESPANTWETAFGLRSWRRGALQTMSMSGTDEATLRHFSGSQVSANAASVFWHGDDGTEK